MPGFLDEFRRRVIASVWKDTEPGIKPEEVDDKIALGVLMQAVAAADSKFLSQEESQIESVLTDYAGVSRESLPEVMASIRQASKERVDLYRFTSEVTEGLDYSKKIEILESLFRVACVDKDLDENELELIRKISGLFNISHGDFISAKIKVKKEFGMDISGI